MSRLDRRHPRTAAWAMALLMATTGCTYLAFLRDGSLRDTFALLDDPRATRTSVTRHFGVPRMQSNSWIRYESGDLIFFAVDKRVLVVLFDDNGRVADYRYTSVKGSSMPRALGELPDETTMTEVCTPGRPKAEVLSRLGPPLAAGPRMFAYLAQKGGTLRGRILRFDEDGRFVRLTRTALEVPDDDTGAGPDLSEALVARLETGLQENQVRALLGPPQMVSENLWGYCATSVGHKKLVVVEFGDEGRLRRTWAREAVGRNAGQTTTCYLCHHLSFSPTCLDCHAFGDADRGR